MPSTRYDMKWDWKVYLLEWSPEIEGIILCEMFHDHRALSRKYEAEKKGTDRKEMGFPCENDD